MSCLTLVLQIWGCAASAAAQESCTSLFNSVDIPKWKLLKHSETLWCGERTHLHLGSRGHFSFAFVSRQ